MDNSLSLYKASPEKPFHLSVGAVIINEKNQILCHYYEIIDETRDIYTLMRKTLRDGETLEDAMHRGMKEEFGVEGKIITFLGSTKEQNKWFGEINQETIVEKTTLYFLVKFETMNESEIKKDLDTKPVWKNLNVLIEHMERQLKLMKKDSLSNYLDEVEIVKRVKKYLS